MLKCSIEIGLLFKTNLELLSLLFKLDNVFVLNVGCLDSFLSIEDKDLSLSNIRLHDKLS